MPIYTVDLEKTVVYTASVEVDAIDEQTAEEEAKKQAQPEEGEPASTLEWELESEDISVANIESDENGEPEGEENGDEPT